MNLEKHVYSRRRNLITLHLKNVAQQRRIGKVLRPTSRRFHGNQRLNSKDRCSQFSLCVPIGRFEFLRKYKRFTNKDINTRAFTVRIEQ
jgi:hypothetical protein